MAIAPLNNSFYADPANLSALKREASAQSPEALREVARQFESLFTQMMLKSMRSATPQDSLFGSDQQDFYQDMFDTQMSSQLSKGRGLGLADMLVKQLMQAGVSPESAGNVAAKAEGALPLKAIDSTGVPTAQRTQPMSKQDFIDAVRPAAERAAAQLGVDADTLVAHAALETGWGRSLPRTADGSTSNNLFGIKAGGRWDGAVASASTHEYEAGRRVGQVADFRAYASAEDCLQDYARVIGQNPRYAEALNTGSDTAAFAGALQRGGYATDPDYAKKLVDVARQLKSSADVPITRPESA
ncbi:MAG: flagellar assembly peptidoglycan hydrolase FlgJ [Steroidobacteraceae bacterium]